MTAQLSKKLGLCLVALALVASACEKSDPGPGLDGSTDAGVDAADGDVERDGEVVPDGAMDGSDDASADADTRDATVEGCDISGAPVVDIVIVDFRIEEQPARRAALQESLSAQFNRATDCLVGVRILDVHDLEVPAHDTTDVLAEYPYVTEVDAQRLWYYEAQDVDAILSDLSAGIEGLDVVIPDGAVVVALSEPQFEAGAYYIDQDAHGLEPLIIIESYTLGGWAIGEGYTTRSNSALYLADEIIHELGHFMGLRHACQSCFELGDYDLLMACCDACPHAEDVMSYCRTRIRPEDEETNIFLGCTLDWIEFGFLPAYTADDEITYQPQACEL